MKFTLELPALVKMVQQAGKKMPGQKRADRALRLYACAARVFVECNQTVAGMEALVLEDGGCTLPRELFLKLLKSYAPKPHITIEADERTVRFGSTTLNSVSYLSTIQNAESMGAQGNYTNGIILLQSVLKLEPDNERAKELVADYTNREQQRLEAVRQHEAELAEAERQRQARQLAEQQAQQRALELSEIFNAANRPYENASQFSSHELVTTNSATVVGNSISSALTGANPPFENVRLNWINQHLLRVEARQRVGIGYRDCLIIGSQVRDNETRIQFKVFEYEQPPKVNLLGGLMQLQTTINSTPSDPQVAAAQAETFQLRIKDGIKLVTALIQRATGQ